MRTAARLVVGAALLVLLACWPGAVAAATGAGYAACPPAGDATAISASLASCDDARGLAVALAAAPATAPAISAVLGAAGWVALRAAATIDGSAYDLVVTRGHAAVSLRRPGLAPDLDGWAAGRELIFAHQRLVSGKILRAAACTSGFLIRIGARLAGLSAAHCGGLRHDGRTQRANVGLLRRPQPGIVLGRVARNLERTKPLDALVVPVPVGVDRPASPVVDRGVLSPPWFVTGMAAPYPRLAVCMTGQTSGADQCGTIAGASALPAERLFRRLTGKVLRCTTIVARPGDSGGPVYTAPAADGTIQAVGVATLVITGLIARLFGVHMCFTPIAPVLGALGAQLVTAG